MATHKPSTVKKCLLCGNEFFGYANSRYCKEEKCQQRYSKIRSGIDPDRINKCQHCGKDFVGHGKSRYCKDGKCKQYARTIKRGFNPSGRTRQAKAVIIDGKKQCKSCGEWISTERFRIISSSRNGKEYFYSYCRDCELSTNKDRALSRTREQRIAERKRLAEKLGKSYTPRQKKIIPEYTEKLLEKNAKDAFNWWFSKKTDEQVERWFMIAGTPWLNPRKTDAEQYALKYKYDVNFAIKERMRRQIKKELTNDDIALLIRQSIKKEIESKRLERLVGYSVNELRAHLEKQFTKGMTWDKFKNGEIHIDHIIPKKAFKLSSHKEWKICWSLPNLRPLWAKQNISKGAKVLYLL